MKTVVDLKQLFYGDAWTAGPLTGAAIKAFLDNANTKEVKNVHATTWTYEEEEPSTTDYINQLNGQTYYRDNQPGATNISFTIGQYEYETKADLQGGTATPTSWVRPTNQGIVYKGFVAVTKDDTYIAIPKGQVTARGGMVEDKLIGLPVVVTPVETGIEGLASEGWFDASEVA